MPLNVETLTKQERHGKAKISGLTFDAFSSTMMGKWSAYPDPSAGTVSPTTGIQRTPSTLADDDDAEEAVKTLSHGKNVRKHLGIGAVGAAAGPLIAAASRGAKGFLDTKGGVGVRTGGALKEVSKASLGDVGSQAVGGGLGGVVSSMGLEEIKVRQAQDKLRSFLQRSKGGATKEAGRMSPVARATAFRRLKQLGDTGVHSFQQNSNDIPQIGRDLENIIGGQLKEPFEQLVETARTPQYLGETAKRMKQKRAADGMTGMGGTTGARVGGTSGVVGGAPPFNAAQMANSARGAGDFTPSVPKAKAHSVRGSSTNPRLRLLDAMNKGTA